MLDFELNIGATTRPATLPPGWSFEPAAFAIDAERS